MKTKKIWRLILWAMTVAIIWMWVFINVKNVTIATLEEETATVQLTQEVLDIQNQIIMLREHKFELCEKLGMDMPIKLVQICPEPTND